MKLSIQIFIKGDDFKPSPNTALSNILLSLAASIENGEEMKPGFATQIRDTSNRLIGVMSMLAS